MISHAYVKNWTIQVHTSTIGSLTYLTIKSSQACGCSTSSFREFQPAILYRDLTDKCMENSPMNWQWIGEFTGDLLFKTNNDIWLVIGVRKRFIIIRQYYMFDVVWHQHMELGNSESLGLGPKSSRGFNQPFFDMLLIWASKIQVCHQMNSEYVCPNMMWWCDDVWCPKPFQYWWQCSPREHFRIHQEVAGILRLKH